MTPDIIAPDDPLPAVKSSLSIRTVIVSIALFWAFYFLIATAKTFVIDGPGQLSSLFDRALVTLAAAGATMAVYFGLRRVETQSVRRRIATAMLLSVLAALSFGCSGWYIYDYRSPSASPPAPAVPPSGVTIGTPNEQDKPPFQLIVAGSVNGYFFFVAWCGLYLALTYSVQLSAMQQRAAQLHAAAQAANLRALRYQVNPHFLFNTLNTISALILGGHKNEAERMVTGLASFFRASLTGDPTADVPLSDEIELQRLYLNIEATRFGERLKILIEIPDHLAMARVPGLILQPLVENAIKHAVSQSRQQVTLSISAAADQGTLRLLVADDGNIPANASSMSGAGVGLVNVRERIIARYGDQGTVRWGPRPDRGYHVMVTIPLVFHDD